MTIIYILTIIGLLGYIVYRSRFFQLLLQAWHDHDIYSKKDKLTLFDVRRLIIKGEIDLAVRVYCELFKVTPEEAEEAVEEIERSIQPKDFEF